MDSDVLIVGAGPTGLTLAIDLGKRGVRCMLVEQKERPAFLPKMERINARTMEIYRRMGLAQQIRAAGLRPDCPDGRLCRSRAQRAAAPAPRLSVRCAGASRHPRDQRRQPAARTLPAHLAIHARAAVEIGGRDDPGRQRPFRLRVPVAAAGRRGRHRARAHARRRHAGLARRLSRRLRRRRQPGAQGTRHQAVRRRQSAGVAPGALSLRRSVRQAADRQRARPRAAIITSPTTRRRS